MQITNKFWKTAYIHVFWFLHTQISTMFPFWSLNLEKFKLSKNLTSSTTTDIHIAFSFPSLPIKVLYLYIFKDCIKSIFFLCLIRKHYHNRSANKDARIRSSSFHYKNLFRKGSRVALIYLYSCLIEIFMFYIAINL